MVRAPGVTLRPWRACYAASRRESDSVGLVGQATDERTGDVLISPLTAESGARALSEACRNVGLDSTGAELIRIGSNAVYRLQGRVIARIAPSTGATENAA